MPIGLEPAGVEVNDVGRDFVFAELGGNVATVRFGEISDAAHPQAERPERGHGCFSGDVGVFVKDIFRLSEKHEQVEFVITNQKSVIRAVGSSKIAGDGCGGVHEHAIATAGEEERDGFVHAVGFGTVGVVSP